MGRPSVTPLFDRLRSVFLNQSYILYVIIIVRWWHSTILWSWRFVSRLHFPPSRKCYSNPCRYCCSVSIMTTSTCFLHSDDTEWVRAWVWVQFLSLPFFVSCPHALLFILVFSIEPSHPFFAFDKRLVGGRIQTTSSTELMHTKRALTHRATVPGLTCLSDLNLSCCSWFQTRFACPDLVAPNVQLRQTVPEVSFARKGVVPPAQISRIASM